MWNRRPCKVSNYSSNYLQPDKQWRPSVEAADCSKAFIWRRSGGNNGIIVLDDGYLSHRYLHRPANISWHQAVFSLAVAAPSCSPCLRVQVCAHDEVCVGIHLGVWECQSCRSGCVQVGLKCVCVQAGESQPSTPCFLDNDRARNEAGQQKFNLPFINLYTCILNPGPTEPDRLVPLIQVIFRDALYCIFLSLKSLQSSVKKKMEDRENRAFGPDIMSQ